MSDDNIRRFPRKPAKTLSELITQMKEELPNQIEYMKLRATMQHAHYTALVEKGFSPAQAMMIIVAEASK